MDNPEKLATYEYTRHQSKWFFSNYFILFKQIKNERNISNDGHKKCLRITYG